MIKAVIFDFDGVIVDSEPLHFKVFQELLKEMGIDLGKDLYVSKYLAFDDKTFFTQSLKDFGKYIDNNQVSLLIERKSEIFESFIADHVNVFPGVKEFLENIFGQYPIAIGSGALRSEIEKILKHTGLDKYFDFIVSADEVELCKPNPEVYLKVHKQLNDKGKCLIDVSECLVFEDAVHGIVSAKAAGMHCIAVSNSFDSGELFNADKVIRSFEEIDGKILKDFN